MCNEKSLWLAAFLLGCGGSGARGKSPAEAKAGGNEPLVASAPGDSPARSAELQAAFGAGQFERVVSECPDPREQSAAFDVRTWCSALVPASLHALGQHDDAVARITEYCSIMAPADKGDARANLLAMIMLMLADAHGAGRFEANGDERDALLERWLQACGVPVERVEEAIVKSQSPP